MHAFVRVQIAARSVRQNGMPKAAECSSMPLVLSDASSAAGALSPQALADIKASLQNEIEALELRLMELGLSKPAATIYGFSSAVIQAGARKATHETAGASTSALASIDVRLEADCSVTSRCEAQFDSESDTPSWHMPLPNEFGVPLPSAAQRARYLAQLFQRASKEPEGLDEEGDLADLD